MRKIIKKLTPRCLRHIYQKLRYVWIVCLFYLFRFVRINRNRIVLCNVWGYGDNAKYVTKELVRQKLPYELIFVANHIPNQMKREGVRFLKTNSIAAIFALATARVWVESNRKEAYICKRKGQYYIQLWHGGLPLKKIEGDCADYLGTAYIKRAKRDSQMTDLFVSNGEFCTNMYRRAFWFHGNILECGTPRNDVLFQEKSKLREQVRRYYHLPIEQRIVLFAPTYREISSGYSYSIHEEMLLDELTDAFGGEWSLLLRMHPLVATKHGRIGLNGSEYEDMYELMAASDILITDYSNTMFEFALMKQPVFLYAQDKETYLTERGVYFAIEELPFSFSTSMEDLIQCIRAFDQAKYIENTECFFKKHPVVETGEASYLVADHIKKVMQSSVDDTRN